MKLDLFKYKNIVEFLNDVYHLKKSADPKFSYELLATELNFKSRSMIRMIFKGEINISDTFIHRLQNYLKLNQKEADYLVLLSQYHNTNEEFLKNTYFNKINELSNFIEDESEIKNYDLFLSSIEIPAIFMLLSYEDTHLTTEHVVRMTGYTMAAVQKAVQTLEKLGLIMALHNADDSSCAWKSTQKNVKLNSPNRQDSLDQFHQKTMNEAHEKIQLNADKRKFRSVYLTLDEQSYENFTKEIEDFIQRTKNKYLSKNLTGKKLYKFNTQTYPITPENKK